MVGPRLSELHHMPMYILYKWNYWQVEYLAISLIKSRYWRDFKLVDISTVWREIHACSINGLIMAYS